MEYDSRRDADIGADRAKTQYGSDVTPYLCDACGKWHLAPTDRIINTTTCPLCTSREGLPKDSYESEAQARKKAANLRQERGEVLSWYKCRYGNGWHLTKG